MKCVIIHTPHAMKSKVEQYKNYIRDKLFQKFDVVDFWESKFRNHTSILASEACGQYDCLIALGGDGTFNEVLNGIAEKHNKPVVGFLPCGTVNDVARSLGISRKLDKALNVILDGKTFKHDVFKVNNRYGIYVVAAGLLTGSSYIAGQENKRRYGWLAYAYTGIKELFRKHRMAMKIECDGKVFEGSFAFMFLSNSNSIAGMPVNKNAELNDGLIDVVLMRQFGFLKITNLISVIRLLKLFIVKIKKIKTSKYFVHIHAKSVKVYNYAGANLNIDGEFGGNDNLVTLHMLKEEIEIFVPNKNKRVSPYLIEKF
jgi:YegS/Rv2252/BmrU family lipid kinase